MSLDPCVPAALREIQMRAGRPALAMVPLMVRGERIGLVLMSCPSVHHWQEAELQPYEATAAQLATAIDSRRQNHALHERSRHLAVLEERQRLARDLHDSVTQILFSLTLIAQSIGPAWRRDPAEGEQRVSRVLELSQVALQEMRSLLKELSPFSVGTESSVPTEPRALERVLQDGLPSALRKHLAEVAGEKLPFDLEASHYRRQSPEREEALFRVGQEAINNTVKHAGARTVTLSIGVEDGAAELLLRDNGCGFELESARAQLSEGRFGLAIMRQRIEALGGVLEIVTMPGKGTCVRARLPALDGTLENE